MLKACRVWTGTPRPFTSNVHQWTLFGVTWFNPIDIIRCPGVNSWNTRPAAFLSNSIWNDTDQVIMRNSITTQNKLRQRTAWMQQFEIFSLLTNLTLTRITRTDWRKNVFIITLSSTRFRTYHESLVFSPPAQIWMREIKLPISRT